MLIKQCSLFSQLKDFSEPARHSGQILISSCSSSWEPHSSQELLSLKKALHSARYLPNHGAALELDHDRTGDVALIPLTSSAGNPESFSQTLLHRGRDSRTPGCGGGTSGTLHHTGGGY